jgi:gamma-tubulin complex component 3
MRDSGDSSRVYKRCLQLLTSQPTPCGIQDEFRVVERIKKRIVRRHNESDAVHFSELCRRLESQTIVGNRWSILYFLLLVSEDNVSGSTPMVCCSSNLQRLD